MRELTRKELSGKRTRKPLAVPLGDICEEFAPDGGVYVRVLSGTEYNDFKQGQIQWLPDDDGGFRAKPSLAGNMVNLLCRALCDKDGARLYGDDEAEEVGNDLDALLIERLYEAASKLNGIRHEDGDDLKNASAPPPGGNGFISSPALATAE